MKDLLVTIIVPIYNVEKYLHKCVDSILAQTHSLLEIILVDDGSVDASSKICDDYKEKDERIIVIHKQNGGLSSSRNAGLKQASGAYVLFVDGDDWIREDAIELLLSVAEENKVGVVQMGILPVWDEASNDKSVEKPQIEIVSKEECFKSLQSGPDYVSMCNKLISQKYWNVLCFPEGYLYEDMYVNYKLFAAIRELAVCSDKMYYYRQHSESICKRTSIYEHDDYFNALNERCEFYKTNGYRESYKQELIFHMSFYIECYLYCKNKTRKKDIRKLFKEEKNILKQEYHIANIRWELFHVWPDLYREIRSIYIRIWRLG